jgi:phage terminase large subunit-like protein
LAEEGLPVTEFPQSAARMTPATKRTTDLINTRQVTHSGSAALTRHVSNATLKSDSRGVRITKESKSSERRIDLAVAMVMGLERAMTRVEEPALPEVNFY